MAAAIKKKKNKKLKKTFIRLNGPGAAAAAANGGVKRFMTNTYIYILYTRHCVVVFGGGDE